MTRENVYSVINSERDYQKQQTAQNQWNEPKRVGEFLFVLRVLLHKAELDWYGESDVNPVKTLAGFRKIAATAVACMETHGAPPRE